MGVAELIVAICLQAEPGACRVFHRNSPSALNGCALAEEASGALTVEPGWYLARWSCRWRR
ncbi:MAG TPA: hypothetical protein VGC51_14185 [Hansschlegelia sp.]